MCHLLPEALPQSLNGRDIFLSELPSPSPWGRAAVCQYLVLQVLPACVGLISDSFYVVHGAQGGAFSNQQWVRVHWICLSGSGGSYLYASEVSSDPSPL